VTVFIEGNIFLKVQLFPNLHGQITDVFILLPALYCSTNDDNH